METLRTCDLEPELLFYLILMVMLMLPSTIAEWTTLHYYDCIIKNQSSIFILPYLAVKIGIGMC